MVTFVTKPSVLARVVGLPISEINFNCFSLLDDLTHQTSSQVF